MNYQAIRDSYGFRGRYWSKGEIAHNVTEDEKINCHFRLIGQKKMEKSKPETKEPDEKQQAAKARSPKKNSSNGSKRSGKYKRETV